MYAHQITLLIAAIAAPNTPMINSTISSSTRMAIPAFVAPRQKLETRCGWYENPTPGNVWFRDRDGEWTIGIQGGYQVEGEWDGPYFKDSQWVRTNVNYGYGCACMRLRVDKNTKRVVEIKSATARPLAACRKDRALKDRR
ncbi:MAG: DUF4087 domain-containing protein [Acidobacteria bacterium]|nr:DUF4087 domain-containing protein [Acidobacteriota bacterium]